MLSHQIANFLYSNLNSFARKADIILDVYDQQSIWNAMMEYKKGKLNKKSPLYYTFDDIVISYEDLSSSVFLSQVYITTNNNEHLGRAENTLALIDMILEAHPDISAEYIQFVIKTHSNETFTKLARIGEHLKPKLHIIEIEKSEYFKLLNVLNLKPHQIPEYYLRNVGVRLGQGKLLMTGSEDIYPSPIYYGIIQRKLISPLMCFRNPRMNLLDTPDVYFQRYKSPIDVPNGKILSEKQGAFWYHYGYVQGPSGDIQGAPREQMYRINGWKWGRETYYVDKAFYMDQKAFKVPTYEIVLHFSGHQRHKLTSNQSPYHYIDSGPFPMRRVMYCAGYASRDMQNTTRKNWGISYDFADGDRWGHFQYKITPVATTPPFISNMTFYITYNYKRDEYNIQ